MRIALGLIFAAATGGLAQLAGRTGPGDDVCADVKAVLEVPNLFLPGQSIKLGTIDACLCLSTVPTFILTNPLAITAAALVGQKQATAIITKMINSASDHQTCKFPDHAVHVCKKGSPCFFTCKDGFVASPAGDHPTSCVCPKGTVECNGKCIKGLCPSGHHSKRDILGREVKCAHGLTACGVLGRSAKAWDCVDVLHDLESCGGCAIPLYPNDPFAMGVDCTSLPGVADVACLRGSCIVRRCMPGYNISKDGSSCIHTEDKDPEILAAQYGLEHVPM